MCPFKGHLMDIDFFKNRTNFSGMARSLKSTLFQIAVVISGIWVVLWFAKKISGTSFLVCLALTYVSYLIIDSWLEHKERRTQLAYDTAGCNERASQYQLAAAVEQTRHARWIFFAKLIGAILLLFKLLPVLVHWLHHI